MKKLISIVILTSAIAMVVGCSNTNISAANSPYDRAPDLKSTRIKMTGYNTFLVNNTNINLYGITPIHFSQKCLDADSTIYNCGYEFQNKITKFLHSSKYVRCYFEVDYQPTYIGNDTAVPMTCFVNGYNLSEFIISEGYALSFTDQYANIEKLAMKNKMGVWRGKFMNPTSYQKFSSNGLNANDEFIKGNYEFSYSKKILDCDIKGVNRSDGKVYVLPGDHFYDLIEVKPIYNDKYFCSEQEALENGFRRKL